MFLKSILLVFVGFIAGAQAACWSCHDQICPHVRQKMLDQMADDFIAGRPGGVCGAIARWIRNWRPSAD